MSDRILAQSDSELKHRLSVASYYSSGDYGEPSKTDILYFPFSYEASKGKWAVELTLPHIRVEGLGNVLVNIGGVNRAVAGTEQERNQGLGDSTLALTYQMDTFSETSPFIDLRLDIKLPTADQNKGLGTGEYDYSAQLDVSQNFGNSVLFGTFGYTFRGKTDLYEGLEDSAYVQLGIAKPVNASWSVGIFYDFREPASEYSPEVHEIVPYVSWQLSERWSITGLAAFGATEASADTAILGQLNYSW